MDRNFISEERQKFRSCCSKLRQLVPARDEESRKTLNALLDELNSLDYSIYGIIDEVKMSSHSPCVAPRARNHVCFCVVYFFLMIIFFT